MVYFEEEEGGREFYMSLTRITRIKFLDIVFKFNKFMLPCVGGTLWN